MPDLIYLSFWLREFETQTMLGYWQRAIQEFPASQGAPGVRSVAVYPLNWSEVPLVEQVFEEGISAQETLELAQEFLHPDCAYEAQLTWDLWTPKPGDFPDDWMDGWERKPQVVSIICLGTEFDRESPEDLGHLAINFGLESNFLPPEEWDLDPEESQLVMDGPQIRENIATLIHYARRWEQRLPVARRRLWCESGEDLAEQILS
ncbi:MAG: hypothetical protein ACRD88_02645, partial [Terriglobia bacterium]